MKVYYDKIPKKISKTICCTMYVLALLLCWETVLMVNSIINDYQIRFIYSYFLWAWSLSLIIGSWDDYEDYKLTSWFVSYSKKHYLEDI